MEESIPQPRNLQLELGLTDPEFERFKSVIEENVALMQKREITGMEYCSDESFGGRGFYEENGQKHPISGYSFCYNPRTGKISTFTTGAFAQFDEYIQPTDKYGIFSVANRFKAEKQVIIKKIVKTELDQRSSPRDLPTSRVAKACIEESAEKYNSEINW